MTGHLLSRFPVANNYINVQWILRFDLLYVIGIKNVYFSFINDKSKYLIVFTSIYCYVTPNLCMKLRFVFNQV